jgi:hypothetical protein
MYSRAPERKGAGAGPPPPDFVGGTTSGSEWIAYFALAKVLKDPPDPRQPPFFGGVNWGYQIPVGGTFTRELGSAVVDYVYYSPHGQIFIRLQTRRFHEGLGPAQQGYDVLQRSLLGTQGIVVDVYEADFIDADPTVAKPYESDVVLQAACAVMSDAIRLTERSSPIFLGTSQARG